MIIAMDMFTKKNEADTLENKNELLSISLLQKDENG